MSTENNKALLRRYVDEVWNKGDLAAIHVDRRDRSVRRLENRHALDEQSSRETAADAGCRRRVRRWSGRRGGPGGLRLRLRLRLRAR